MIARPFTEEDHHLSRVMMSYWLSFAKDGQPAAPGEPAWQPYDKTKDAWMHLDTTCAYAGLPDPARTDFLQNLLSQKVLSNS